MLTPFFKTTILLIFISCNTVSNDKAQTVTPTKTAKPKHVCEIALPETYQRMHTDSNSFAFYLQHLALKEDNTVYYYDGTKKSNQHLHFAVLNVPVGNKNLQQCADAVMRLRAMYYFERKEYSKIVFKCGEKTFHFQEFMRNADVSNANQAFEDFMEQVFINCGTYHLADMLHTKENISDITIGDVFVKAGSPGHAMIVVDVAINKQNNQRIYLLAQSFMPAQSVHIVINPINDKLSPWYKADKNAAIITPGYVFNVQHLKQW